MADTKVFTIKINGIEESAKAVQILTDHLEELKRQGKSLKDISIDISAKSKKDIDKLDESVNELNKDVQQVNKQKLVISVGNSTREFDNLRQAAKILGNELRNLYASGQQNTEVYQQLAEAYGEVRAQISATTTELERFASPSAQLVDTISVLQGFTAVATVGAGIKNLFGIDGGEVDEAIKKMTSLIGVLEGLNKIQEAMEKQTAFGKIFGAWNDQLDKVFNIFSRNKGEVVRFNRELQGTQQAGNQAAQGLQAVGEGAKKASLGVNILKGALRTVWLFAFIEGIMLLVEWLGKGVKAFSNWISGTSDAINSTKAFSNHMKVLNEETDRFYKMVDNARQLGLISDLDAIDQKIQKLLGNLQDVSDRLPTMFATGNDMNNYEKFFDWLNDVVPFGRGRGNLSEQEQAFSNFMMNIDKTLDKFIGKYTGNIGRIEKNIDTSNWKQFETDFESVSLKVQQGTGKLASTLEDMQRSTLREVDKRWKAVDKTSKESVQTFYDWVKSSNAVQETLKNLEALLGDTKYAQQYREGIESIVEILGALEEQAQAATNKLKKMSDDTKDNNIAAMADGMAKDIANIKRNKEKALEEQGLLYKKDSEMTKEELALKNSIVAKYAREEYNINKTWGDKTYQVRKQIRDNILAAERKGYALQVEQIKNAMADEIHAAQQNGILVGELRLSIQKKYNAQLEELERQHQENVATIRREQERRATEYGMQESKEYFKAISDFTDNFYAQLALKSRGNKPEGGLFDFKEFFGDWKKEMMSLRDELDEPLFNEKFLDSIDETISKLITFDAVVHNFNKETQKWEAEIKKISLGEVLSKGFDSEKVFLDALAQEQEYINASNALEQTRVNTMFEIEKVIITNEAEMEKARAEMEYDTRVEALKKQFDYEYLQRQKDSGQINELEEQLLNEFNDLVIAEYEDKNERIKNIENHAQQQMILLAKQTQNEIIAINKNGVNEWIAAWRIVDNYIQAELQAWGTELVQFGQSWKGFNSYLFNIGTINLNNAKKEYVKISQDIANALMVIDAQIEQLKTSAGDNREQLKSLQAYKKSLQKTAQDIKKEWIDMVMSTIGQYKQMVDATVSTISNFLSTMNDTAMTLIDNQLAVIEQQLSIQQEAYDRAEEAANAHKDRMNDIEDELSEARGARREFLIDQLAQQEAAYLEDLAAQQRAAEEKEKLEKKQEALEKKRRQQEKKAQIQQAIINTYTAVSNALAVQPWFLGLALSAVALGLGMANVAAISQTPVYKDGGVIQGRRHSQGGVKVLGGQAEVEGGEFITNRTSTRMNLPLLEYINSRKKELDETDLLKFFSQDKTKVRVNKSARKFAQGGQVQKMNTQDIRRQIEVIQTNQDDRPIYVSVVDIENRMDDVRRVRTLAGL